MIGVEPARPQRLNASRDEREREAGGESEPRRVLRLVSSSDCKQANILPLDEKFCVTNRTAISFSNEQSLIKTFDRRERTSRRSPVYELGESATLRLRITQEHG